MTELGQKIVQLSLQRRLQRRMLILRRWFRRLLDRLLLCSIGKPIRYRMLSHATAPSPSPLGTPEVAPEEHIATPVCHNHDVDSSDLVALKITLLGDRQIGKTSFLVCILDFHSHNFYGFFNFLHLFLLFYVNKG
jgi:Rab family protein